MPLLRRIPKRGFNNRAFRTEFAVVNVEDLNEFPDGAVVTPQELLAARLISKLEDGVKILGDGELTRRLTVQAQRFSRSAREKIAKAGGQCVELPLPGIRSKRATGAVSGATS